MVACHWYLPSLSTWLSAPRRAAPRLLPVLQGSPVRAGLCKLMCQVDLSRYTLPTYMRIVTYKTAFYSFYLPVACGLLVAGVASPDALALAKDICLRMGQYFQVSWQLVLLCTGALSASSTQLRDQTPQSLEQHCSPVQ